MPDSNTHKESKSVSMDLRLNYMMANKDPVTESELYDMIRRLFAAYLCGEDGIVTDLIQILVDAHFVLREDAAAQTVVDDAGKPADVIELRDSAAEQCYVAAARAAYRAGGFNQQYAEEAAMWPDVLPLDCPWCPELLKDLAELEVGYELVAADYMRAMNKREWAAATMPKD